MRRSETNRFPALSLQKPLLFFCGGILLLIMLLVIFPQVAYAEGSKDLVANGGYRPYLEHNTATLAGEERTNVIGVYAKKGETIYFGSSVQEGNLDLSNADMGTDFSDQELDELNANSIVVCDPSWNREENPEGYPYLNGTQDESVSVYRVDQNYQREWRGYIGNRKNEQAGPKIGDAETGYIPHSIVAESDGVYYFWFYPAAKTAQDPRPSLVGEKEAFGKNQGSNAVAAWDVTVCDDNDSPQTGRVFTERLSLTTGLQEMQGDVILSNVYILTEDAYAYRLNFNGLGSSNFMMFSNLRGMLLKNDMGYRSLFHSVRSNNTEMSDLTEHGVYINSVPTEEIDRTHRIFFSEPDSYAMGQYCGTETLSEGELSATPTNFSFAPLSDSGENSDAAVTGFGGFFTFENDGSMRGSTFQITLDFSTENDPENKLVLSSALVEGNNSVFWSGTDRYGNVVNPGVYDSPILFEVKGGETHFIFLDAENSEKGIQVQMLNTVEGDDAITLYYNNQNNRNTYSYGWSEKNWTVADGKNALAGLSSSEQALSYQSNAGDQTALDVWAYHSVSTEIAFSFEVSSGETSYTLAHRWDTSADPNEVKPGDGDEIEVQLQWRVKDSNAGWEHYSGKQEHYHVPISYVTKSNYDPKDMVFEGLEQYAGRDDKGTVLLYEYRVVETSLPEGYVVDETSQEAYDLNDVSHALIVTAIYAPGEGFVSLYAHWQGDSDANEVRPNKMKITLSSRVSGTDDSWRELSEDEGGQLIVDSESGWTKQVLLPQYDEEERLLEYRFSKPQYSFDDKTWSENVEGYGSTLYSVIGATENIEQSEVLVLSADQPFVQIEMTTAYTTCLTVDRNDTDAATASSAKLRVQLQQDGVDIEGASAELTKENSEHTFTSLETGHVYTTRVIDSETNLRLDKSEELGEDGYSDKGEERVRGYRETYVDTVNATSFTVKKEWSDALVHDPVEVELTISYNNERPDYTETTELSAENKWSHTFENLATGGSITVKEKGETDGFFSTYSLIRGSEDEGYEQIITAVPDTSSITIRKVWEGDSAASEVRPEAVRIKLFYRERGSKAAWEEYENSSTQALELSALNGWSLTPRVASTNEDSEYEYYVEEISYRPYGETAFVDISEGAYAQGYKPVRYVLNAGVPSLERSSLITFDKTRNANIDIVSTYTTSLTVVASWQVEGEVSKADDLQATIQLQKDGEDVAGMTVELREDSPQHTFEGLDTGHTYAVVGVDNDEKAEVSYTAVDGEDGYSTIGSEMMRGYFQGVTNIITAVTDEASQESYDPDDIMGRIGISLAVIVGSGLLIFAGTRVRSVLKKRGTTEPE